MLPPYPSVDLRIDPSPLPLEERRVLRRGAPERLRLEIPASGWPPLLLTVRDRPPPVRAGGGWARRWAAAFRLAVPS